MQGCILPANDWTAIMQCSENPQFSQWSSCGCWKDSSRYRRDPDCAFGQAVAKLPALHQLSCMGVYSRRKNFACCQVRKRSSWPALNAQIDLDRSGDTVRDHSKTARGSSSSKLGFLLVAKTHLPNRIDGQN